MVGVESESGGEEGGDSDVSFGGAGDETNTEADEAGERMGLAGNGWLEA